MKKLAGVVRMVASFFFREFAGSCGRGLASEAAGSWSVERLMRGLGFCAGCEGEQRLLRV